MSARQATLEGFLREQREIREEEVKIEAEPLVEAVPGCPSIQRDPADEEPLEIESAPELRERTDDELKAILATLNTSEAYGLRFGLFPADKIRPGMLSKEEAARLMKMAGAE